MEQEEFKNRIDLTELNSSVENIKNEISKVIVGQEELLNLLIVSILASGHALIEGVPGIAKTLSAKLLAKSIHADFNRIQFTPDLMPSDIIGTSVFNPANQEFTFKKGPIFSNILLIDEINRSPAKTQSALFEVMEERQITVDGKCYTLDKPFLVFATQNPIEHEGTYRLPEAQLDRFLFRIKINYPNIEEETKILSNNHQRKNQEETSILNSVIDKNKIIEFQNLIKEVHIEEKLLSYIAKIVSKTRNFSDLYLGASPRASLNILNASKAYAAMQGKDFVSPADIQYITPHVLNHRIILSPEKEMEGIQPEEIIKTIVSSIDIPQ